MKKASAAGNTTANTPPSADDGDWDIRILRRVVQLEDFPLAKASQGPIRLIGVVDCETTGIDPVNDQIIDIAYVMLEVDARGEIVSIRQAGQALCDPGMPIPEHITRLTGLTDADVLGKAIDLDALEYTLRSADVLIAHNCRFDAAFIRHLLPRTDNAAWACSSNDIGWLQEAGLDGRALGHLLMNIGFFNDGHRAMADVISLLHLLAWRLADGRTVLGALLANAERTTIRIEAVGAPFEKRHILKARGYRWDASEKVWGIEIAEEGLDAESLWLAREVTPYGPPPRMRTITWRERYR